jgi:hypothetical protein
MTTRKLLKPSVLLIAMFLGANSMAFAGQSSPSQFVQSFYDWYVALKDNRQPSELVALRTRREMFDRKLVAELEADFRAAAEVRDYVVGLDFDPFLNSQDPASKYFIGTSSQRGNIYTVSVYSTPTRTARTVPDVVVELERNGGSWRMMNFDYPGQKSDLKSDLRLLRQNRERYGRHSSHAQ